MFLRKAYEEFKRIELDWLRNRSTIFYHAAWEAWVRKLNVLETLSESLRRIEAEVLDDTQRHEMINEGVSRQLLKAQARNAIRTEEVRHKP